MTYNCSEFEEVTTGEKAAKLLAKKFLFFAIFSKPHFWT